MEPSLDKILNEWGVYGAFIVILIIGMVAALTYYRKDIKELNRQQAEERKQDREAHLSELRESRRETNEIAKSYSRDSRELGIILKEFEILLKQKNRE